MKLTKLSNASLTFTAAMLLAAGVVFRSVAQTTPLDQSSSQSCGESSQVKIARAVCRPRGRRQGSKDCRHRRAGQDGSSARGE
jgi:hypothetical protein